MFARLTKVMSIILVVVMLSSVLVSCKAAATPETEPTKAPEAEPTKAPEPTEPMIEPGELEVGVGWEEGTAFDLVKEIGDSMEEDYPGTEVSYTFINSAARPAIEMRMEAGDPVDLDWSFNAMRESQHHWVDNGFIMDLTDVMYEEREDGTSWADDFNPLFLPAISYKDRIWGAPVEVWVMLLHYNKGMFDEMGLEPPTTWDELLEVCETIKGNGVAPIAVTGQVQDYVGIWSDHLFQRVAGKDKTLEIMWEETDKKMADDADFLLAAQELNKLSTNGYLIEGWEATDFTTAQLYFFQGKAAMMMMGSWLMKEMVDSIPEGFELGVAPFPTFDGGTGDQEAMFGNVTAWNVPAASDVPDLAVEFLRRYTSDEEATKRMEQLGAFSPNINVAPPNAIYGGADAMRAAMNGDFILYFFGVSGGQFGMSDAWYGPVVQMWTGTFTPEEMLAEIDANLESVRAQRKEAGE